ncbi:MAG TPA: hypothetical protein V6D17_14740 [Candidatus Obscuribacterales bacterium]
MPKSKTTFNSKIETYLAAIDHDRFLSACRTRKATRAAIAREAILFYLDNLERAKQSKRETELSINIKNMTDRICGMLARQGAQTGTLYELAWQNHFENKVQERFIAAANTAKAKMRKRLESDERAVVERMKNIVEQ